METQGPLYPPRICQLVDYQQITQANSHLTKFTLRSNLPAWLLLMLNVAAEYDFLPHFSVCASLYYSGWNLLRFDFKFRILSVMPEVRWWLRRDNRGLFAGIHGGVAWYNLAFGRRHRYQDHDGKSPALGGGVSLGYRFPLRSRNWGMEVALGGGLYRLDYDVFRNEPGGVMVDRRRRTLFCLDTAALSVCYSFGMRGKGGAL